MADKPISQLEQASQLTDFDLYVIEQDGTAKCLIGQVLLNWLADKLDAHGGIRSIEKTSTDVLVDTYTITYSDETTDTFTVTNAKSIEEIQKSGTVGLVDTYTISFNDNTSYDFNVTNGKAITNIVKTGTVGIVDTYTIYYNDTTATTFNVTNGRAIVDVQKTSTQGLVDTYTITYNDETTSTFTVTNGEKGDNAYVWIRYSHDEPTQDSDIHTTADDWIGINTNHQNSAPSHYTDYTWYKVKGEKGDKGDNSVVTTEIKYGSSQNEDDEPTTWYDEPPTVAQGSYLWIKTTFTFSTGGSSVFYSKTRMGIDGGGGTVNTVNNVSADANGDVDLISVSGTTLIIKRGAV